MDPDAHREFERIQDVTSNYFFWQGLRWIPPGFVILVSGLRRATWWPLDRSWGEAAFFAAIAAAVLISPLIGRYYERTFGRVWDCPGAHRRRDVVKWCVFYPLMFCSLIIDLLSQPAFFITGPVWAAGIIAYWWSTGQGRQHYLVAAFSMLALSFAQWRGLIAPGLQMFSAFGILLGSIYIIGGLLDHFELRRILQPIREGDDEAAV